MDNELSNNIVSLNFNSPFLDANYPKIMSYVPVFEDSIYKVSITDIRVQNISKIELKLQLPELKGKGTVSYKKNYNFHLLKNFSVSITNPNDSEFLLESADGEDVLINALSAPLIDNFINTNGGSNDEYCYEKTGDYDDCIIFPSREIIIPIKLSLQHINIFPQTKIVFRFELNNIKNIISYNTVFEKNTLSKLIDNFNKTNLNIKLEFNNTIIYNENNKISNMNKKITPMYFVKKQKATSMNNTKNLNSKLFKNVLGLAFYVKSDIYNSDNKFIVNPGADTREKKIINNFRKNILKDLIVVTDKDLTKNTDKLLLGYNKESNFVEIEDNVVYFTDDKREFCNVYIELVPETHKVYFHKNLLTFSRRHQKNNILNISNLFRKIKGVYFEEDESISFILKETQDKLSIYHASIPVNIWSNTNNTATGDLRSSFSKENDFYYSNSFLLGMDFLSKDSGYGKISISAGRDSLENCYQETTSLYKDDILKNIKFDNNAYPHTSLFITHNGPNKLIESDKSINFDHFLAKIIWNIYPDYDPVNLYHKYPYLVTYHLMELSYNFATEEIALKEV